MRPNKGGYERIKRRIEREPSIRQHAIDQMMRGAIILRELTDKEHRYIFKDSDTIYQASDGTYFTTARPLDPWLRPYFLRDDALDKSQKEKSSK